jgi:glycerol-3-phosphate acyltransferase PlsX
MVTVVVDAMGGDYAPKAPVEGALQALEQNPQLQIILTGSKEALESALEGKTYDSKRLSLHYTSEVIENEEHSPAEAIREKRDSSMAVGLRMVKEKQADGMVSAGNTGALLAGGTLLVGRIPGVARPVLSIELPVGEIPTLLLDVGANMDAKTSYLVQFAQMSTIYMRKQYGLEAPKVGLLNVGVEPGKGNAQAKEAFEALQQQEGIHFIGNVEAREVLFGRADIVVTDAFAGNVLLKSIEGTAEYIVKLLKSGIYASTRGKLGGLLLKPVMKQLKGKLDPASVGGTPLLGVNGAVIKAHGNSKAGAFANAIRKCSEFASSGITAEIADKIKS